ncbi:netrin receptor UNC5D-like [Haliotis rufescens]|uniref:netrin receptor UNC5D-like n=1 Tax=Haliotis rufescens TaxID=6454 RepID=UPI001EAF9D63|nr:netrin receptor UNC5D-like [Haliotis rufescens]XP_046330247.1 netrin receptor UNC5D-like [Haliotis rufescens]
MQTVCVAVVVVAVLAVVSGTTIQPEQNFVWGKWSSWSESVGECSASCGGGSQTVVRTRKCQGGLFCKPINGGKETYTQACNTDSCHIPVNGGWGEWGEWTASDGGECSAFCGGGKVKQSRVRSCDNPEPENGGVDCEGESVEQAVAECNTQGCRGYCPDRRVKFFPHPTNRGRYYQCGNYIAYLMKCPKGLVWDDSIWTCNFDN